MHNVRCPLIFNTTMDSLRFLSTLKIGWAERPGPGVPGSSSAAATGEGWRGGHPYNDSRVGGGLGDLVGQMTGYRTVATKNYCDL